MMSVSWKSAVTWSLLGLMFLLFALMFGPAPALASDDPDAVLYEVTEDMYLMDEAGNFVASPVAGGSRMAVAQLSGWAKIGTPLCPWYVLSINPQATRCTVNATGADNLSLVTGKGTLGGTYAVVVQGDNDVDAPEFVIMRGTFAGDADLSLSLSRRAPLGYITNGVATVDGLAEASFKFTGTFRLPFGLDGVGRHQTPRRDRDAYYLNDGRLPVKVKGNERSLGFPTVRLEINF